jgi:hypothetical protein
MLSISGDHTQWSKAVNLFPEQDFFEHENLDEDLLFSSEQQVSTQLIKVLL